MELITLKPYTEDEKLNIALKHLVPREIREHGLMTIMLRLQKEQFLKLLITTHLKLEFVA